jgi:hypothetical protein
MVVLSMDQMWCESCLMENPPESVVPVREMVTRSSGTQSRVDAAEDHIKVLHQQIRQLHVWTLLNAQAQRVPCSCCSFSVKLSSRAINHT